VLPFPDVEVPAEDGDEALSDDGVLADPDVALDVEDDSVPAPPAVLPYPSEYQPPPLS
jgi:hypothetical protein